MLKAVFPGVEVQANSPQGQVVQCSEKPQNTPQTLQASVSVLNVKVRDRMDRKGVSCFEGLPGESLFSLKRTLQHSLDGQCASEQTTRRLEQCSDKTSVKHSMST